MTNLLPHPDAERDLRAFLFRLLVVAMAITGFIASISLIPWDPFAVAVFIVGGLTP